MSMSTALLLLTTLVLAVSIAVVRNRRITADTLKRLQAAQVSDALTQSIADSATRRTQPAKRALPPCSQSSTGPMVVSPVSPDSSAPGFSRTTPTLLSCPPQAYNIEPYEGTFGFASFPTRRIIRPRIARRSETYLAWQHAMHHYGLALHAARVTQACFVHGTFVGNDPFSILRALQGLSPKLHQSVEPMIGAMMKKAGDFVAQDAGNFSHRWVQRFQTATEVPSSLFVWSSENTHAARLVGAIQLAKHLTSTVCVNKPEADPRILLIGHSHAAQVFSILLQLIYAVDHSSVLLKVASILGEDIEALGRQLEQLRPFEIDVVTLGAPVRYGWPKPIWPRLLHIINHRGDTPQAGSWEGLLTTRDGDYLQQLGVAGSDLPAFTADLRTINLTLDDVLGPGWHPKRWFENLQYRRRIHQGGFTLLVNYQDHSSIGLPNCISTNFGHAIYTRWNTMRYLTYLIQKHLYPKSPVPAAHRAHTHH
ncbi:MAG: hypothetical protein KTR25_11280 [Myxococcales bacterium]|nr:hypothetical protein [Myxococcales bacterium]